MNNKVVNHPQKEIFNLSIIGLKSAIDTCIIRLGLEKRLSTMSANDIKQEFLAQENPEIAKKLLSKNKFEDRFLKFVKGKSEGTMRIYMSINN